MLFFAQDVCRVGSQCWNLPFHNPFQNATCEYTKELVSFLLGGGGMTAAALKWKASVDLFFRTKIPTCSNNWTNHFKRLTSRKPVWNYIVLHFPVHSVSVLWKCKPSGCRLHSVLCRGGPHRFRTHGLAKAMGAKQNKAVG